MPRRIHTKESAFTMARMKILLLIICSVLISGGMGYKDYSQWKQFYFVIEMESSAGGISQIFFDTGQGSRQQDSSSLQLRLGFQKYLFPIPESIKSIRFDPIKATSIVSIKNAGIENGVGDKLKIFPVQSFKAIQQINKMDVNEGVLTIQTAEKANDPIIVIGNSSFQDKSSWINYLTQRGWISIGYALLLFAIFMGLVRHQRQISSALKRIEKGIIFRSKKQLFRSFAVWCFVVAFVLPNMFFAETLILLEETTWQKGTAMVPIWFLWLCGIPIFITGLAVAAIHRPFGQLYLIGITATTLVFLKLEYIPFFARLDFTIVLTISLVLVFAVVALIFRENLNRLPSLGFFLILGLLFIAAPLVSAKVEYFRGSESEGDLGLAYCFDQYVDSDPDLLAVFESRTHEETKAQWGKRHFTDIGETKGRRLPPRCKSIWVAGKISFRAKPNLYVLLFDSLIPEKVANTFFGLGSAGYAGLLKEKFHVPAGITLAEKVSTKPSFKRFMWLDMSEANPPYVNFAGEENSPLVEMLRGNGYSVTTGHHAQYWGRPGKYIDKFLILPQSMQDTILCSDPAPGSRGKWKGLGICSNTVYMLMGGSPPNNSQLDRDKWEDLLLQHIIKNSAKSEPGGSIFYTYNPIGHTPPGWDLRAPGKLNWYRKRFVSRSVLAKELIEAVINTLETADPNALLVIAGDHGTYVSRNSKDEGFGLVDKHGVAIGVLKSENVCAKAVGENGFTANRSGYHTLSTVVMSLVECLSDDQTILANWPAEPVFSFDRIGDSWDTFLARNLSDSILEVFKRQ